MPITEFYDKGALVRVGVDFQATATGAYVDPATIRLLIKKPQTGTQPALVYNTDAAVKKDSTGRYYADLNVNESGVWTYRWEGTGANQAAFEDSFEVRPSAF